MDTILSLFEHIDIQAILVWIGAVVAAATAANAALAAIAKVTETKKDDAIVEKVNAVIAKVRPFLDKIGVTISKGK